MTNKRLSNILGDTELLSTITYEELKTLALSYPFAHNLRVLLAVKAKQEGHSNFKKDLATASMYALDRKRLFQVIAPKILSPQAVVVEEKEEVLTLEPIEKVKEALKAKQPEAIERQTDKAASAASSSESMAMIPPSKRRSDVIYDFSETLRQKQVMRQKEQGTIETAPSQQEVHIPQEKTPVEEVQIQQQQEQPNQLPTELNPTKETVQQKIPFPDIETMPDSGSNRAAIDRLIDASEPIEAKPQTSKIASSTVIPVEQKDENSLQPVKMTTVALRPVSFGEWVSEFKPPVLSKATAQEKQPHRRPGYLAIGEDAEGFEEEPLQEEGGTDARRLAAKSVQENQGLVSETLAKLYIRQGYNDKAIAMYERLSLAKPEKSAYFAAEIKKLKN